MRTMKMSFYESAGLGDFKWVGADNFIKLFHDQVFWDSILNTLKYTLYFVPISMVLSLIFAVLINSDIKGTSAFRMIYFLPMVVAPAAVSMVWKWLYNKEYGIINYLLGLMGLEKIAWLTDPKYAIIAVAIVGIWSIVGYNLIIFSAGLKDIPKSYYESADIDGANPIQKFWHITVPLISKVTFFVLITTIMTALKQFDNIYVMIGRDNPIIDKTQTVMYYFYKYAFIIREKGYASVIALAAFALIMLVTVVQIVFEKKWVHYD